MGSRGAEPPEDTMGKATVSEDAAAAVGEDAVGYDTSLGEDAAAAVGEGTVGQEIDHCQEKSKLM